MSQSDEHKNCFSTRFCVWCQSGECVDFKFQVCHGDFKEEKMRLAKTLHWGIDISLCQIIFKLPIFFLPSMCTYFFQVSLLYTLLQSVLDRQTDLLNAFNLQDFLTPGHSTANGPPRSPRGGGTIQAPSSPSRSVPHPATTVTGKAKIHVGYVDIFFHTLTRL